VGLSESPLPHGLMFLEIYPPDNFAADIPGVQSTFSTGTKLGTFRAAHALSKTAWCLFTSPRWRLAKS
jgi:hypothetical protein